MGYCYGTCLKGLRKSTRNPAARQTFPEYEFTATVTGSRKREAVKIWIGFYIGFP
jgi:hypothetical protein